MDVELEAILKLPLNWTTTTLAGEFVMHQASNFGFSQSGLAVVKSGIGPVMGAMATQAALHHWPDVEVIISLGVGGALIETLQPGDLVLAARILKHDTHCAGNLMRPGELWISDPDRASKDPGFNASTAALEWMRNILHGQHFLEGTLLSGDEFVVSADRKRALCRLDSNTMIVDMEAGGIAQAALRHRLPFLALRTTADRLDPSQGVEAEYLQVKASAADCAAVVVQRLWDSILSLVG